MSLNMLQWATRMSTHQLIRGWGEHNRRVLTERTCLCYGMAIWRFADSIPKNIKDLTPEHIERYLDSVLKTCIRRTVNNHLTAIKSFCRWVSENYGLDNPASKVKFLKADPPKRRFLSVKEYNKILNVCQDGEDCIIKFLANTGLRSAELQELQTNNFSYDLKTIRFAGKNRQERTVPLNKTTRSCITENSKLTMNFLESYRKRNALYALCKKLSIMAGIPIAGPHSLRRFFGNCLLKKGVSIYYISKLYGHASVAQTEQYLSCDIADLEGITDVLDS